VQTRLQENLTRVNWHLDFWSQNGPTLTLSLSRDAQVLERRGYEGGLERDDSGGTSASAVLSFRLGAGAPLHLRTLGLLQEASRYSRLAKEREIRAQITQTYLQLRGLTAQLQSASDSFRQVRTALQNTTVQNSDDVDTYMSLVSSAEGLANSIVQLTAQETLLRIQAQSLIGSLLDSLERGPATRARRQP
jgi:outer membrane protein TolC